ncbi:MAG: sigma-54-dependent Fis family transcriptional regulator [Desulfobacterales bacterium]|nr:sigma-54-dependent Fis family transcriptional regulator [Desulfobacterales bacterium]
MNDATVLIVDDEPIMLTTLEFHIKEFGYTPICATDGSEALNILENRNADLILSDHVMPNIDGLQLLKIVRERYDDIPFIMLTAYGSIDNAITFIQNGADDYLTKPYKLGEFDERIANVLKSYRLRKKNGGNWDESEGFQNIVTQSDAMHKIMNLAAKVAKIPNADVILYGESGTGKEMLARSIHTASGCTGEFVGVNCAAIPSSLLESELFGHVKGAFTGAEKSRQGKLGMAQNGTLLLDEIGDMPLELQIKLLRIIEERTYEKVGSDQQTEINTRIIAATHRDLATLVKKGKFRNDLFHRINTFPITLPPLKKRKEDIPLLAKHFIRRFQKKFEMPVMDISQSAMDMLKEYRWDGNVRELKNCIQRAFILTDDDMIRQRHLHFNTGRKENFFPALDGKKQEDGKICIELAFEADDFSLEAVNNEVLDIALKICRNNKARAAELLKVSRNKFYRRKS